MKAFVMQRKNKIKMCFNFFRGFNKTTIKARETKNISGSGYRG